MVIKPPINNNNKDNFLSHIMPSKGGQSPNAHLICAASAGEANTNTSVAIPLTNNNGPLIKLKRPIIKDNIVITKEVAKFNIIISPIEYNALTQHGSEHCWDTDLYPDGIVYEGVWAQGV